MSIPIHATHFYKNAKGKVSYYLIEKDGKVSVYNAGTKLWNYVPHSVMNPNLLTPLYDTLSEDTITSKITTYCTPVTSTEECDIVVTNVKTKCVDLINLIDEHTPEGFYSDGTFIKGENNYILEYNSDTKTWYYSSTPNIYTLGAIYIQSTVCVQSVVKYLNNNSIHPLQLSINQNGEENF